MENLAKDLCRTYQAMKRLVGYLYVYIYVMKAAEEIQEFG